MLIFSQADKNYERRPKVMFLHLIHVVGCEMGNQALKSHSKHRTTRFHVIRADRGTHRFLPTATVHPLLVEGEATLHWQVQFPTL
jgi:hypothetical protein